MALTFHWFLPAYGDSRFIIGGGHGLPAGAPLAGKPHIPFAAAASR